VPGFSQQARLLDQLFIRTEGDVFHTETVYTGIVFESSALPTLFRDADYERYEEAR